MYYISNQTEQIIAADNSLLKLLHVENIDELNRQIILGDISFTSHMKQNTTIVTPKDTLTYSSQRYPLSSMLGNLNLVYLEATSRTKKDISLSSFSDNDEINILQEKAVSIEEKKLDDDGLFEFLMPQSAQKSIDKISITDTDSIPIIINAEKISKEIGISIENYNTFLNEYIDTALSLEKNLQNTDDKKRSSAIDTLMHLANVLHLPKVNNIIQELKTLPQNNRQSTLESFYTTLSRITTYEKTPPKEELEPELVPDLTDKSKSFGSINLDNVKAIHFDFQIEAAANDLGLPVELIEEFVHDFIDQAEIETEKMLVAYEEGDLDRIQKIGHLLKGTSSNLRINPLADTLYEIQFCKDSNQLEDLIKQYWAHFLSFKKQITILTQ